MPERPQIARRAIACAAFLGLLADPLLRNGPWGFGLLIWMCAFAAVVVTLGQNSGRPFSAESSGWLALAVIFAAGLSWRDTDVLQFFDVVAMLTSLTLLAMSMTAIPVAGIASARVRDLIRAAFGTGLDVATGAVPLVIHDMELHAELRASNEGSARKVGRAIVITVPIVLVFMLLFVQADPVFGSFVTLPTINFGLIVSHLVVAGFFAWVVAGWLRRSLLPSSQIASSTDTQFPISLGATDIALALGALNVLFAAFIAVQIGWLFGGEALVLKTTGLTYAEYARRGFFELTCVAVLLLPVLLSAQALIPAADLRALRLFRRLALPLVVLLGAVMASAAARMKLYVDFYGISTDRLYATAFMIWLAMVFVWLAVTVLRSRPRSFATGFVLSGFAVLFALNILNPAALVARANLARGDATPRKGATGSDVRYLASLGGDAVPLLVAALAAPSATADSVALKNRCSAAHIVLARWSAERRQEIAHSWPQWNLARVRAAEAIAASAAELRRLACAPAPNGSDAPPTSP